MSANLANIMTPVSHISHKWVQQGPREIREKWDDSHIKLQVSKKD